MNIWCSGNGCHYVFMVLPFRIFIAPWLFTQLKHQSSVLITSILVRHNTIFLIQLLSHLGFLVSPAKFEINPVQDVRHHLYRRQIPSQRTDRYLEVLRISSKWQISPTTLFDDGCRYSGFWRPYKTSPWSHPSLDELSTVVNVGHPSAFPSYVTGSSHLVDMPGERHGWHSTWISSTQTPPVHKYLQLGFGCSNGATVCGNLHFYFLQIRAILSSKHSVHGRTTYPYPRSLCPKQHHSDGLHPETWTNTVDWSGTTRLCALQDINLPHTGEAQQLGGQIISQGGWWRKSGLWPSLHPEVIQWRGPHLG